MRVHLAAMVFVANALEAFVWSEPAGITEVRVNKEFGVRITVSPTVTQVNEDGEVIAEAYQEPPYRVTFKYDPTLVKFQRIDENGAAATATVRDLSPWRAVDVETSSTEQVFVVFKALRATEHEVAFPASNVLANGSPLELENPDKLLITPKPGKMQVRIVSMVESP